MTTLPFWQGTVPVFQQRQDKEIVCGTMLIGKIIIYSLYYLKYNNIEQRPNLNEEIIIKTKIKKFITSKQIIL